MCITSLPVNSAQCKVIVRLLVTANCNAAREQHVTMPEKKDYFSLEACKNDSKHRKSRKSCVFNTAEMLLNRARNNQSLCELTLPTIEAINFSTRRYSSIARRLEQTLESTGEIRKRKKDIAI